MTDRGLPIVDGAPACPFVAFEDDRDGRGQAPDHRHRCYAEPRPAPRALAHQEAYCLSSAFPVCPTFQDWARREAAATRPQPAEAAPDHDEVPVSQALPPRDRQDVHAPGTETPPPLAPRRNPPRDWAAPPPWSGDEEGDGGPGAGAAPGEADAYRAAEPHRPADPDAVSDPYPPSDPYAASDADPEPADPPPFLGSNSRDSQRTAEAAAYGAASRGLAGSAADRLAGGAYPDETGQVAQSRQPFAASDERYATPSSSASSPTSSPPSAGVAPVPASPHYAPQASAAGGDRSGASRSPQAAPARRETQDASELFGPAWERPRRYEAYPTLRPRVTLPGLGRPNRVALAAIAVILAAVVLFFVGPMLLGIGGGRQSGGGGGSSPAPSAEATATAAPTPSPAPTPQVYIVAKGDTISKIARRFHVTVQQLLAANKQIKDPNKIRVGDQITIPVPVANDNSTPSAAP
jgi:LysM domain